MRSEDRLHPGPATALPPQHIQQLTRCGTHSTRRQSRGHFASPTGGGASGRRATFHEARPSAELDVYPVAPRAFPQYSAIAAMEAGRTAVLRVKRKRNAEPAEALVLACKRLRSDEVESSAQETPERQETAEERNVFQLVATVRSQV